MVTFKMEDKEIKAIDHWLEKTDEYYEDGDLHVSHFVIEGYKAGFDAAIKDNKKVFWNYILVGFGLGFSFSSLIDALLRW